MHNVLFDCCKELKHLSLCCCDNGTYSVFKIDAPKSKLCFLEIDSCRFERLELVCLPKLEKFICITWVSKQVPVTFGFVPSLGELELSCAASYDHCPFKLSELLHGTTSIHTLTLDFEGEIVWEHACEVGELRGGGIYRDRRSPQWEMRFDGSENRLLKELEFGGFKALEQQFAFIRSMLERSPNLQKVILRGDGQCDVCGALDASLHPSKFPKKDEEEMVAERIRDGIFSPEIIFEEHWPLSI